MKYTIKGPWSQEERTTTGRGGDENQSITVVLEVADLVDERGILWREGAYRVRSFHTLSQRSYERTRTFKGEMAWADGQRLFDDIVTKIRYGRD